MAGVCGAALVASPAIADKMPEEKSLSGVQYELIGRDDLYTYKALPQYNQAPFLDALVAAGKLPPVNERLPKEPVVFKTGAMVDGLGEYGGVFRHVIGGRPEGFNWLAGQHQGWGGINMAVQECLVRQGPRWQIKSEEQSGPLPNLAKSWEWNSDMTELTMHLIEGAKWSDGDPFDTQDIAFWYNDNVEDTNVASRITAGGFGGGAKLEVIDDYTFKFIFPSAQSNTLIEGLAYIQGCPGPSHILKDKHPKYNSAASYDDYLNAMPSDNVPIPVMGAWVPVEHRPDEIVIMRRNPYYWKVDEAGNQLPYINEMHFKLTTWDDRTTQAVAGTGDFSNMENPGNFVEALKQSQDPSAPVSAKFGPRTLAWRIELNYAANMAASDYDKELRNLFRNLDFRKAMSHAIDRDAVGQALARGPFAYPYMGGFASGSPYYKASATFYTPFDQASAAEILAGLGLKDTDGNGVLNLPGTGDDLVIDMVYKAQRNDDRKQVDAVTSQLAEVGIRVLPKSVDETSFDPMRNSGDFTAILQRANFILPTRETCGNLPVSDICPAFHLTGAEGRDMLPFEAELADLVTKFNATDDAAAQAGYADRMQTILSENIYNVGLVQIPAALLVNKRVKNAHPGTPVFMYEWAEDSVIRERLWVPADQQISELLPNTVAEY
ncbi:MAG: alpha-galactoside ABC transporter substrate-binding protein [Rhodobacteraceae bacterium]|jgi:peptide/nickel transport system substrate-binding protein|nr:alpha-galactoside ABC transporter substrate-binding protein [Paracoccaceae bacterium]